MATQPCTLFMQWAAASDETKACIPVLCQQGHSIKDICHPLGIQKTLAYNVLNQHHQFGSISIPHVYSSSADLAFISVVVNHCPSIYLDELQDELRLKHNIHATLPTLSCALKQLGVMCKAISTSACERNDLKRALYMNWIAEEVPDPNMLVFIDKAAKDEHTVSRRYGCSRKGIHCSV